MGRPKKYQNEEERRMARLNQTRAAVIRWRHRQREGLANASSAGGSEHSDLRMLPYDPKDKRSSNVPSAKGMEKSNREGHFELSRTKHHIPLASLGDADELPLTTAEFHSALEHWRLDMGWESSIPDFSRHSEHPLIDLYPGLVRNMALNIELRDTRFPYGRCIDELAATNNVVELAVFTLGSSWSGLQAGNLGMLASSKTAYFKLMSRMRRLVDAMRKGGCSILPAVVNYFLVAYESFMFSIAQTSDWGTKVHYNAQAHLVEASGPAVFANPIGQQLLRLVRSKLIFNALGEKRPTFLDSSEWRDGIFANGGKTSEDKLWQLVERIPGLVHRAEVIGHVRNKQVKKQIDKLNYDISALRQEFHLWLHSFLAQRSEPLPSPASLRPFDMDFFTKPPHFISAELFRQMTTYWFWTFVLSVFVSDFEANLAECLDFTASKSDEPSSVMLAWQYCQQLHCLLLHGGENDAESSMVHVGLRVLIHYFRRDAAHQKELDWCITLLKHLETVDWMGWCAKLFIDHHYPSFEAAVIGPFFKRTA